MALLEVGLVVAGLGANAVVVASASMRSNLDCTAVEHMLVSMKVRMASQQQSKLLHSIVDYKLVHMFEGNSVHIGCRVLQEERFVVMAYVEHLGIQEHSSGNHILAYMYEHIVDHRNLVPLVA